MRRLPLVLLGLAGTALPLLGCATSQPTTTSAAQPPTEEDVDFARVWMAEMDARPPEERVPHWDHVRSLMVREAPRVGEPAPDFALERRDGGGTIRLSEFQPTKPVVLIFGSWT